MLAVASGNEIHTIIVLSSLSLSFIGLVVGDLTRHDGQQYVFICFVFKILAVRLLANAS